MRPTAPRFVDVARTGDKIRPDGMLADVAMRRRYESREECAVFPKLIVGGHGHAWQKWIGRSDGPGGLVLGRVNAGQRSLSLGPESKRQFGSFRQQSVAIL